MNKKFLAEAVKKAYEEGGNAILVQNAGSFFVLNMKDWVADDALVSSFVNPIFDKTLSDLIKSGTLSSMKRSERVRKEDAFVDEIESNLDNMVTREEIWSQFATTSFRSSSVFFVSLPSSKVQHRPSVKEY